MEFKTLNGNTLILSSDTTTHRDKIQMDDEGDIRVFHLKNRIKMLSLNMHTIFSVHLLFTILVKVLDQ